MPFRDASQLRAAVGRLCDVLLLLSVGFMLTACQAAERMAESSIPEDLEMTRAAGSLLPGGVNRSSSIKTDGAGRYTRFRSDRLVGAPLDESSIRVNDAQVDAVWRVVQEQDFFSLAPPYVDPYARDDSYAMLTISAGGGTHRVEVRNARHARFATILENINGITPEGAELVYRPARRE